MTQDSDVKIVGAKRAGFFQALVAVLWSFAGIRRRKDYEFDASSLSPLHVIAAGLICGALFVLGVIVLVRVIVWQVGTAN